MSRGGKGRGRTRGVRYIGGQEYLLADRVGSLETAETVAVVLREHWERVRIIKLSDWDYLLYAHAAK